MAMTSERMLQELSLGTHKQIGSNKFDEIAKKQNPVPTSLCRWFHILANNVRLHLEDKMENSKMVTP
jgi:hypothetical protein